MITAPILALLLTQPSEVKQQIRNRYEAWDAAYRRMDLDAIDRLLDSSFSLVTDHGSVVSRSSYLARLAGSQPPTLYKTTVLRVVRKGQRALAQTSEQSASKGEATATHFYTDTWVLRGGHWRMLVSKTTGER